MNWIDIICLSILLIFALIGLYRGFLRSIFRILAWIIGIVCAICSHLFLSDFVIENFDVSAAAVKPICLIIGFVIPFALAQLIGHFLHTAVSHTIISKPNRILGALFGILKASLICFLILTIVHFLPLKEGTLYEMRKSAIAYEIYLSSIEIMGYPTERNVILKKTEKKAKTIYKDFTKKTSEKVKESADIITNKAKTAAENATESATDKVKEAAIDAAGKVIDNVSDYISEKNPESNKTNSNNK